MFIMSAKSISHFMKKDMSSYWITMRKEPRRMIKTISKDKFSSCGSISMSQQKECLMPLIGCFQGNSWNSQKTLW